MLSIVVPVFNEEESLGKLHEELSYVARSEGYVLDVVFVGLFYRNQTNQISSMLVF